MITNAGKWTAGADPELFLQKDGNYVAVQPYVDGTKEEPQPLPCGGNVQKDNVAIEFGIKPAWDKKTQTLASLNARQFYRTIFYWKQRPLPAQFAACQTLCRR